MRQNAAIHLLAIEAGLEKIWLGLKLKSEKSGMSVRILLEKSNPLWSDGTLVFFMLLGSFDSGTMHQLRENKTVCVSQRNFGQWSMTSCNKTFPFICKYGNSSTVPSGKDVVRAPPATDCSAEWGTFGNNCYFYSDEKSTWKQALESCIRKHPTLQLAILNNEHENKFVTLHITTFSGVLTNVWMGIYKHRTQEKSYSSIAGTNISYKNWLENDESNSNKNRRCATLSGRLEGKWAWKNCKKKYSYVCKMPRLHKEKPKNSNCPDKD